ncbi:gamma-glutamylcyclotransferase family protein [Deinococcus arenicola]|uniref:Putative gamma-glutamylcyclotransferase n=1 Tax=Deinococcus arenicola TaxID=2994950 RepID=A0ABU4DR12_9DEIO|nr:gamma-glutamylcyclotransferase family protein [Deinococcus sp. ZS9-10]MDV6374865.1 gamma-glutamylcyclotransferase [Deinococcus sp. ZS9-10]
MTESSPPYAPLTTVFVYGTLMPGERNAHIAQLGGTFSAQPARLPGFRLLHLYPEAYPAVLPGEPQDGVTGFALTYAPADWPLALPFLDELEGIDETPPLYTREEVTLTLENGQSLTSWVYIYAVSERLTRPGALPVSGGDWTAVANRSKTSESDR